MPDGEFFTGPVEDSAEGEITFHLPASYSGREVAGVRFRFEGGKVVDASAERGEDFLIEMLDTDEGARRLGELGIGTNFGIADGTGEILLDEKIGGTVHLAVGQSYPETGGVNESAVHWDMICDLRRAARSRSTARCCSATASSSSDAGEPQLPAGSAVSKRSDPHPPRPFIRLLAGAPCECASIGGGVDGDDRTSSPRRSGRRFCACALLESRPCPVIRSGPRSSTRRAPPTPSAASSSRSSPARSRSPRGRAAATPRATRPWPRRSRRPATNRCRRTTSSGRSTAARARAPTAPTIERIVYEGYGPGGAAILVEALSDNRNRTGSEIRHAFDRHGGSLGEPNSVAWQFEKRGVILLDGDRYGEDDLIVAIDAGAEDVVADGDVLRVLTAPTDLTAVRAALEEAGDRDRVGRRRHGPEDHGRGRARARPGR